MKQQSAWVRKSKNIGVQEYPLTHKWYLSTDSLEKMLGAVSSAIEDTGYRLRRNPFKSKRSRPLETATIPTEIVGYKRIVYIRARRTLLAIALVAIATLLFLISVPGDRGIGDIVVIVIGVIVSVLGGLILDASIRRYKLSVTASLKGNNKGLTTGPGSTSNNDSFLAIRCDSVGDRVNWMVTSREQETIKSDFQELRKRIDSIIASAQ